MQGRIAGFFMTLVMALPLAAIPLMSIFGVPQIGSLASSLEQTGFLLENPSRNSANSAAAWDLDSAPAFGEAGADIPAASRPEQFSQFASHNNTPQGESMDAAFAASVAQAPTNGFAMAPGHSATPGTAQNLSWEQAIQQLARYGIRDYRLQPGFQSQGFHFACYSHQTGAGGPAAHGSAGKTVIRFEAEATDPLQAIQQTLQQVIMPSPM